MSNDPGESYDLADDAPPRPTPRPQSAAGRVPQPLGYAGYGSQLVFDNSDRARTASLLIKIYAALSVLTTVLGSVPYFTNDFARAFGDGADPFGTDAGGVVAAAAIGNLVVGCIGLILFVVAAVYYCMWQYRATANANVTGNATVFGPGLGVGAWFIPLANLVMVPMMLFSLWRASGRADRADRGGGGVGSPGALLAIFLLFILLILALGGFGAWIGYQSASGGGLPGRGVAVMLGVGSLLAGLLGALFWYGLAKYVDEVQAVQAVQAPAAAA